MSEINVDRNPLEAELAPIILDRLASERDLGRVALDKMLEDIDLQKTELSHFLKDNPEATYAEVGRFLGVSASTGRQRCLEVGHRSPKSNQEPSEADLKTVQDLIDKSEETISFADLVRGTGWSRHYVVDVICQTIGYQSPQSLHLGIWSQNQARINQALSTTEGEIHLQTISQKTGMSLSNAYRYSRHQNVDWHSPTLERAARNRQLVADLIKARPAGAPVSQVVHTSPLPDSSTYYYLRQFGLIKSGDSKLESINRQLYPRLEAILTYLVQVDPDASYIQIAHDLGFKPESVSRYCQYLGWLSPTARHRKYTESIRPEVDLAFARDINLNQRQLAKKFKVHRSTIGHWRQQFLAKQADNQAELV